MKQIIRPDWDEYFMAIAYLVATRSSCFHLNTGAVIVKNKRIISTGYNGAPAGIKSSLERGYCTKEKHGIDFHTKGTGTCIGRHAEENAMAQVSREEMVNSTMYTVYYPCTPCTKSIIGNDISRLVYSKVYKEKESLSMELFKEKGVEIVKLDFNFDRLFNYLKNLK